jgi:crotonobetainyl-CoA:carnitine CoA-transferase CaiB-like acyl-CoA transferase
VVVQNLRPGLVERLGLAFDDIARENPTIVYCSIRAFGAAGPLRDQPGYDPLMQAAGGIMSVTGEADRPPVRTGASIVDQGTAMWSALGILAALRARDAGAAAQHVETSLYETAVNWVPYQLVGYLASGCVPTRLGSGIGILAPYGAYPTADGRVMIAAGNDRLFASLAAELGLPELARDERFTTNAARVRHRDDLDAVLAERLAAETTSTWIARFRAAGIPIAPIQDLAEVAASEQTTALGLLQPLPTPQVPELMVVAPPLSVAGERLAYERPPPPLGADSRDILAELGYSSHDIEGLLGSGAVEAAE